MLEQLPAVTALYQVDAANPQRRQRAIADVVMGMARWRLAVALAWLDIRNRYRGSVLGPFWLTLSTGVMLLGIGITYSALFRLTLVEYLPHLAVSLVVWNFISQMVTEATTSFVQSEAIIRQMPLPYTIHALRCMLRNALIGAHNLPLIALVFLVCGTWPGWEVLLVIPGLMLIAINGFALALLLGMVCARFRDIGPIVGSIMQLFFFLTPIIWKPQLLGEWAALLPLNPFYSILETVRGPLIDGGGALIAWVAAFAYTIINVVLAAAFLVRFRSRVAFWV
ncbi:ABC transporter permease [Plastoroseomonas arctica]|uniref:ABC transporter permease n=1 Tax=Plastoroseomonas arctica TaxID=1509237 RepID=A0AAF1K1B6_9PROT|nr:ABC transporter permease [Plastoroseomonas arctica]MBR0655098.1 ABC transporter permease [Plastoroseomonas arctica]